MNKRLKMCIFLLAISGLCIVLNLSAAAQPGRLDTTFNGAGYAVHSIPGKWNYSMALCATPDGKILTGTWKGDTLPPNTSLMILRYNNDGTLDQSFGTGGMVGPDSVMCALDLDVQPDGKILAAGWGKIWGGTRRVFTLFRLNPDGSFDASFGRNGVVQDTIGAWASAVTPLPDGRILAAGGGPYQGHEEYYLLAMHNPDGSPDTTFGASGFVKRYVPNCTYLEFFDMVIQPDGKILLADEIKIPRSCIGMVRFNPDGTSDTGFGIGGLAIDSVGVRVGNYHFTTQADGKILVPAYVYPTDLSHPYHGLFRYNTDGSRDSTFCGTGYRLDGQGVAKGIVIQPDGKILTCGDLRSDTTIRRGIVRRYLPSGEPDPDFGTGGAAELDFEKPSHLFRIAICADGKIVSSGICNTHSGTSFVANTLTLRLNSAYHSGIGEEVNVTNFFRVYPNPTSGKAILELDRGIIPNNAGVEITDPTGKVMQTGGIPATSIHEISLGDLPRGVYFIRVTSGGHTAIQKIIRQ